MISHCEVEWEGQNRRTQTVAMRGGRRIILPRASWWLSFRREVFRGAKSSLGPQNEHKSFVIRDRVVAKLSFRPLPLRSLSVFIYVPSPSPWMVLVNGLTE